MVAGLVRPEIWPVIALAGYLEARGTRWRRLALAGLAGLIAPVLWALSDIAANGRPFRFLVVAKNDGTFSGSAAPSFSRALQGFSDALSGSIGLLAVALGVVGLIAHAVLTTRRGQPDIFPLAAAVIIAAGVAAELWQGLPPYPRYTTSITALLIVGIGWLAAPTRRLADGWVAGAAATAITVVMVMVAIAVYPVRYPYQRLPHLERAVAAIKQARVCGTIGVTGQVHWRNPIASTLAALGHIPLKTFSPIREGEWKASGVVLRVRPPARHGALQSYPAWASQGAGWVRVNTSAGQLWLTGACVQKGGLQRGEQAVPVAGQPAGAPTPS